MQSQGDMDLLKFSLGFTFGFLKIILNSEGVSFQSEIMDNENRIILIKAYLVFLRIWEQNHFMKRYFNKNKAITLDKTPDTKGYNEREDI